VPVDRNKVLQKPAFSKGSINFISHLKQQFNNDARFLHVHERCNQTIHENTIESKYQQQQMLLGLNKG
jgi:hypothetical protein